MRSDRGDPLSCLYQITRQVVCPLDAHVQPGPVDGEQLKFTVRLWLVHLSSLSSRNSNLGVPAIQEGDNEILHVSRRSYETVSYKHSGCLESVKKLIVKTINN